ncbi:MAG TPA: glycoside hydrolase family 3 N-terminal domain-containing protein [Ktedonobacterales bacterium]|jgi:beta-N-acetylhexosaminidase
MKKKPHEERLKECEDLPATIDSTPFMLAVPYTHRQLKRNPFKGTQKLIFCSTLLVILLASLPIGAYFLMKTFERQQAKVASASAMHIKAPIEIAPSLDPERKLARFIEQTISKMSLDEELEQMIVVHFGGHGYSSELQKMVADQHVGGIILYEFNIQTLAQTHALDSSAQADASPPLFVFTDQEGGVVNRLAPITGRRPSAEAMGGTNNPEVAFQEGTSDAKYLTQMGVNVDLAPVVDVQTISDSATIMPGRMFGTTPDKVTTFAGAYLNGLQSQNIIGSLKHWPGLGNATVDPHDRLPVFNRSRQDLNAIDFAPYRALIAQGSVDMIMSTHELVTAYDPNMPASVSPIMIDQVLRHDIGFQGVVITDALYMGALSYRWSMPQAAVLAVIAGNDLLMGPGNASQVQQMVHALHAAVASGQISKARIDLSVERILALKIKYRLLNFPGNEP